jgi:aminotransferase
MISLTKAQILENHLNNHLLNMDVPHLMNEDELDLSADEAAVTLDESIISAVMAALESGQTHYVDVPGIAPLRESVADFLNKTTGTNYQKTNILVTAGMQESRFLTIQMVGEVFGRIAVPEVIHPGVLQALGVRSMVIDRLKVSNEKSVLVKVDNIQSTVDKGTRLLYLESPSRLTGQVYNAEEVAQIADIVATNDVTVIWDQGLSVWVEGYVSLASQPNMDKHVITIGEAFPGTGLSSWFIGYIAAPEASISAMQSQKQIMAICTSTPSQYAALEAGKSYAKTQITLMAHMNAARQQWITMLNASDVQFVEGTARNILALQTTLDTHRTLTQKLNDVGVKVADGRDFGAPSIIRINMSPLGAITTLLEKLQ